MAMWRACEKVERRQEQMQGICFDYFRGSEAEQYNFYRIPKALFTAECFKSLSCEAKVLYGLMLDRMGLSMKNQWFDEENRAYIIFTVEEIMELLCCKTQKAIKLVKELDTENGIGLIEKRRLGFGRPNIIYVKNFLIKRIAEPQRPDTDSDQNKKSLESIVEQGETGKVSIHKQLGETADIEMDRESTSGCIPACQDSRISKIKILIL